MRRDLQRRQPHGVKPAFDPEVFRARFLLLQRGDHLADADQHRLDELFAKHPRLDLAGHDTGRPSNGRIEGTNNLLQVLRRVAHGSTNPDNFAARGLLVT